MDEHEVNDDRQLQTRKIRISPRVQKPPSLLPDQSYYRWQRVPYWTTRRETLALLAILGTLVVPMAGRFFELQMR